MAERKVKVLVVEDSPTVCAWLVHLLSADPRIEVLGTAGNGAEALAFLANYKPDVIIIDINMPGMDGFELTRSIMSSQPLPIIIVSATWKMDDMQTIFKGLEAGAVALLGKPRGTDRQSSAARELLETIKTMAEVKMVRRRPASTSAVAAEEFPRPGTSAVGPKNLPRSAPAEIRLVAIGASTGGPIALRTILGGLPKDFPVPLLIVLHIAGGFLPGFARWLEETTHFPCRIAQSGEVPLPGHAYLAPDHFHMGLGLDDRIELTQGEPDEGLRPSVAHLFQSVARALGAHAAGILLTGMGKDGAKELKLMRGKGALTIAQDQPSCVVFGMPGEAVKLDAATYIMNPEGIAALLTGVVSRGSPPWPQPARHRGDKP